MGKACPSYVGPFRVVERVGTISYQLDRPASMSGVHDVSQVSMTKKHLHDEEWHRVFDAPDLEIQADLTNIEILFCILARKGKELRNKMIPLVKVQWNQKGGEEPSWERERKCVMTIHTYLSR
ncbi:uncharacterized protein LOC109841520 [Asparagus officinalis]|uniref:uncharacterized protein LOC109841520 n=1 Tax=Asparagus officinalis TaxID=4686 RepID=UPI00098E6114|nr:uncharacterized protein LOC109841520 [Asparagus officinalis]